MKAIIGGVIYEGSVEEIKEISQTFGIPEIDQEGNVQDPTRRPDGKELIVED